MIPTKQRYSTVAVPSPGDSSLRRLVIDALLLLLVCSILTVPVTASSSATEVQVSNWTELKNALESPGVSIVTVTADIAVPEEGSINVTGNITLQSDGNNRCIFQTKPLNPKRSGLFIVLSDGHLVVRNNPMNTGSLTLDGRCNDEDYGPPLVYIFSGGTFTMSGGHITNYSAIGAGDAGGCVYVSSGGTFTMSGGNITNCRVKGDGYAGGCVWLSSGGTFTMSGGNITNCSAESSGYAGGCVYVSSSGTFTMSGGHITNCSARSSNYAGGCVCIYGDGTFTMSGGNITNCSASAGDAGGCVYIYGDGTFRMSGGHITNCRVFGAGGCVCIYGDGTFRMSGGHITNCSAESDGGCVEVSFGGTFTMSGGHITNCSAGGSGGGVEVFSDSAFRMSGGHITNCSAGGSGGGVWVCSEKFWMEGGNITNCNAGYNGDGVCVFGKGTLKMSGTATIQDELYLAGDTYINVTGKMASPGGARNIIPENLEDNRRVVLTSFSEDASVVKNFFRLGFGIPDKVLVVKGNSLVVAPRPSSSNLKSALRVIFNSNGGSKVIPVTDLSYGDKISRPDDPTKDSCSFGGWYTDEACTKAWNFSSGIDGDMTLYAKWLGESSSPTEQPTKQTTFQENSTAEQIRTSPTVTVSTVVTPQPTLTQAPAPVFGILTGMLAAGILFGRRPPRRNE